MEIWNIFNGTLNKQLFYNEEIKPVYIEHKWSKWGSNQLIFGIQPYAQIQKMWGGGGWEGIYFQVCRGWGARYIFEEFYDVKSLAHGHMVHALI